MVKPVSVFKEGIMQKLQKANITKLIVRLFLQNSAMISLLICVLLIRHQHALLRKAKWPTGATFEEIVQMY